MKKLLNTFEEALDEIVHWDPTSGLIIGAKKKIQTPALALAHEFGHAEQDLDSKLDNLQNWGDVMIIEHDNLKNTEYPISAELGEPRRIGYYDTQGRVRTRGSTSNKVDWSARIGEWLGVK